MNSLESRIARLERGMCRWRAGCVAMVAVLVAVVSTGAMQREGKPKPQALTVTSLTVVNAEGRPAAA